jgi:hypothetical protein
MHDEPRSGRRFATRECRAARRRDVEPIRDIGSLCMGIARSERIRGIDPIARPLEHQARKRHATTGRVQHPPIDRHPFDPQTAERRQQHRVIGLRRFVRPTHRAQHRLLAAAIGVPLRERGQRISRADFEQQGAGIAEQFPDSIGKPHGLPHVHRPIVGIRCLVAADPRPGHVRDERDRRFGQRQAAK